LSVVPARLPPPRAHMHPPPLPGTQTNTSSASGAVLTLAPSATGGAAPSTAAPCDMPHSFIPACLALPSPPPHTHTRKHQASSSSGAVLTLTPSAGAAAAAAQEQHNVVLVTGQCTVLRYCRCSGADSICQRCCMLLLVGPRLAAMPLAITHCCKHTDAVSSQHLGGVGQSADMLAADC
jgi:hypothetical protein